MLIYYILLIPFSVLPKSVSKFLGQQLGKLYYWIDKRHRKEVFERIKTCLNSNEIDSLRLSKLFYQYLGIFAMELARMPFQSKSRLKKLVAETNLNQFTDILKEGNGCILVTGHFGNWEYAGMALASYGLPINVIVKPFKNESVDCFINKCRQKTGVKIIYQKDAYREALRALRRNEIIVIFLDFDTAPDKGGIFMPFFGKMAATIPSAAMMQLKTNSPIVVTRLKRDDDLIHSHVEIDQIIRGSDLSQKNEKIYEISKKINESYERFITKSPPEWLWLQRRWRFAYVENLQPNNDNHAG